MMQFPPQFVAVKLIARPDGKTDKIPMNAMGRPCDPHDPSQWLTEAEARAVPGASTVGFVFTDSDPYFFIDLDDAAGAGGWQQWAVDICAAFPGAGMEVSSSGKGLHIVGRCDKAALGRRKTRPFPGVEFYTRKRVMALGPYGWMGDINSADFTSVLANWIPLKSDDEPDEELPAGRDPAWMGPEDDEEIIQRMMQSGGSAKSILHGGATLQDRWTGNAQALTRVYPSDRDAFDRSRADAALMADLAFWTGKDAARMDRLFRRSALMREKYEKRADYRHSTILGAIRACRNVYKRPGAGTRQAVTGEAPETLQRGTGDVRSIHEMLEVFKGCVYVETKHRIFVPDGSILDQQRFDVRFGGGMFQLFSDGQKPTKSAFEAFTKNAVVRFPTVRHTAFDPAVPHGAIVEDKDGNRRVNVYRHNTKSFLPGDVSRFLALVKTLFPDGDDWQILLSYSAWVLQNPGRKARWAPVLCGPPGCGKSTIVNCVMHGFLDDYVAEPPPSTLISNFNADLENKLFVNVEEIDVSERNDVLEHLKNYITGTTMRIEPKGVDAYRVDNRINFWFNSNHKTAIPKDETDRRYSIFWTKQWLRQEIDASGLTGKFFVDLHHWLENEGGYNAVVAFLLDYDVPDQFNPDIGAITAPVTSVTHAAIAATRSRPEQEIIAAVAAQRQGFRNGWISTAQVRQVLKDAGLRSMSPARIGEMLSRMGYVDYGHTSRPMLTEGGIAVNVWCLHAMHVPGVDPTDAYVQAQGAFQDMHR